MDEQGIFTSSFLIYFLRLGIFWKKNLRTLVLFVRPLNTCFGLLVSSPLGFKAWVGSLICAWWRHMCYTFPDLLVDSIAGKPSTYLQADLGGARNSDLSATDEHSTNWAMPDRLSDQGSLPFLRSVLLVICPLFTPLLLSIVPMVTVWTTDRIEFSLFEFLLNLLN